MNGCSECVVALFDFLGVVSNIKVHIEVANVHILKKRNPISEFTNIASSTLCSSCGFVDVSIYFLFCYQTHAYLDMLKVSTIGALNLSSGKYIGRN